MVFPDFGETGRNKLAGLFFNSRWQEYTVTKNITVTVTSK